MEAFTIRPLAYIIHPLTGGDLQVNLERLAKLRDDYNKQKRVVPIFPHEIIGPLYSMHGDQTSAYLACKRLLMRCDEVHVYSGDVPWADSVGCKQEVECAYLHTIPVKFGWMSDNIRDHLTTCHS